MAGVLAMGSLQGSAGQIVTTTGRLAAVGTSSSRDELAGVAGRLGYQVRR